MNSDLHRLLARQLRKLGLDAQRLPDASAWSDFLSIIDQTYRDTDQDRYTLERSLAISSEEMQALYQRQKLSYEARLRAIFVTLQDLLWLKDTSGAYLACNPMFERFIGASESKIIGKTDYDFVDKELADLFREHDLIAMGKGGPAVNEEWVTFAGDGHQALLEIVKMPMRDPAGQLVGVLGIARDITERKHADDLLRKSFEEIEDLYNNAACGYHSLDKDGIFRRINDTELAWLGYTRDEVVGKMKWTDLLTPDGIQKYQGDFPRLIKQGFVHDIEIEIVRKNGTILVGLINATAIYDPNGNFVMSRSTVADITERKRAERQLHELSAHIQTVREEEKAHFAREIHDELGSTLAALKIDAGRLASQLPMDAGMLPFQKCALSMSELLDNAMKSTRRIITELRPSLLDDLGLMAALEWQCGQFHERTGIECRVICVHRNETGCEDCKKCEYKLDKTLTINLYRISQEALANVMRHSGASRVEVEFRPGHSQVVLSITDNGCGLPEEHTIASTSYGIRSMCERVAHLGGKIKLDSQPGRGLSVTVALQLPAAGADINPEP